MSKVHVKEGYYDVDTNGVKVYRDRYPKLHPIAEAIRFVGWCIVTFGVIYALTEVLSTLLLIEGW